MSCPDCQSCGCSGSYQGRDQYQNLSSQTLSSNYETRRSNSYNDFSYSNNVGGIY